MGSAGPRLAAAIGLWAALVQAPAQGTRPKEDSGWTGLFNGRDFTGLYVRSGGILRNPAAQTIYRIEGDSIHVPGGSGLLATQAVYSRYQMRVKYKYAAAGAGQNAGLQYHIERTDFDSAEAFNSQNLSVPYFFGRAFVQSIEFQTYVSMAGAYIGIGNLWATTTVSTGQRYSPAGTAYTATPSSGGSRYIYPTNYPDNSIPYTNWVQCLVHVYGADSLVHFINGQAVVRARRLRHVVAVDADGADYYVTDTSLAAPLSDGHVGLQAEGSDIYYRDWDIRLLDAQGRPVIPGCTDPAAANYNPLATVDNGTCLPTAIRGKQAPAARPVRAIRMPGIHTPKGRRDFRGRALKP